MLRSISTSNSSKTGSPQTNVIEPTKNQKVAFLPKKSPEWKETTVYHVEVRPQENIWVLEYIG